jgi:cell division protein FtsL
LKNYKYLTLIVGILIASCTAYFSIFGLTKTFGAAVIPVMLMGITIELGKIILVGYLSFVWDRLKWIRRIVHLILISILMVITSVGIYCFLSNAYQLTANKIELASQKNQIINTKKLTYQDQLNRFTNDIKIKQDRLLTLSNLRNDQETRLTNEKYSIRKFAANSITNCDVQILSIQKTLDSLNTKVSTINDSIASYDIQIINNEQESTRGNEIGPLKYLSRLLNVEMNKIVNWMILLLIFVFDPLAVVLIVASNHTSKLINNEKKKVVIEDKELIKEDINNVNTITEQPKIEPSKPKKTSFKDLKIKDDFVLNNFHKKKVKEVVNAEDIKIDDEVIEQPVINEVKQQTITNNGNWPGKMIEVHPHDGGISVK